MLKKLFNIIDRKERSKLTIVYILMIIGALLDLISVSIVLPIVSLLSNNDSNQISNFYFDILRKVLNTNDSNTLLSATLISFIVIQLFKSFYLLFYYRLGNKILLKTSRKLTHKLMHGYLSMPYEFHKENSSSKLMRKTIYDVDNMTTTIVDTLSLLVNVITLVIIFIYLLFISPITTLIVGSILGIFSVCVVLILKPKTRKISKEVQALNSENYKNISQAFLGIKEAKVRGTERSFSEAYNINMKKIDSLTVKRNITNAIPQAFIEFIGMLGICIAIFVLNNVSNINNIEIIEMLSVVVYGMIKLLPNVINITTILNSFNFYKKSVDTIIEDINISKEYVLEDNKEITPFSFNKEIVFKDVSFAYRSTPDKKVLSKINVTIKKNAIVMITGPSGEGKTTFVDLLLGLLVPTDGDILVDGVTIFDNVRGWRKSIAYVPQSIYLIDDSITKNVTYGLNNDEIDIKRVKEALKHARLDDFVDSLKDKENTLIGENGIRLSGGQKQRIGIARAFYRDSNIIVLDEATNALDYETESDIYDHLRKSKKHHTLIVVSHREEALENVDCKIKINNHKLSIIN